MTWTRKLLPLAFSSLLLLSGCVLADAIEVAVYGPHCGKSGMPPELEERGLYLFDGPRDWDQIDEMIAALEPYEGGHGPDVLAALGISYLRKSDKLSDDPAYNRRGIRMLHWAALCRQGLAVLLLSGIYSEGMVGVEKNPELGACLGRAQDREKDESVLLAGRAWGCGLRVEDLQE